METRAVHVAAAPGAAVPPPGLKHSLVSSCFSGFQHWLPPTKPSNSSLGELWIQEDPYFWSPVQPAVQLLLMFCTSKHTHHGSDRHFLKHCHPPHWYFTELGTLHNEISAKALPALEIQDAGFFKFYFLKISFELLIPQCKWAHKLCLVSAQGAVQGGYSAEPSCEQSNATCTENALHRNSKTVQLSQISHVMVPYSLMSQSGKHGFC